MKLTDMQLPALKYVRNTGGGATKAHFIEDHEPIGELLWNDLECLGLIMIDENGKIKLTSEGNAVLDV